MSKPIDAIKQVAHRRMPPQQRRAQILTAAKEMFTEQGVISVTMRALGRRCGITQASIYQHFVDKDAILGAICDDYFTQMLDQFQIAAAAAQDPLSRLLAVMRVYLDFGLAHPEEYQLTFMSPVSHSHPAPPDGSLEAHPKAGTMSFHFLQDLVADLMASGQLRPGDANAVAEAIWACGHGLVALLITQKQFIHSDYAALRDAHLDLILNGILVEHVALAHDRPSVQNTG
ncbi:MAG: TetR/AcrR family transcriptional regulator [Alphaproteobacteria bacterium]